METRPGCRVHAIIVTSCHGNDEAGSTLCLIMQHKPYIVDQPPTCPFKSYYKSMQVGVEVQSYKTDDRDREYQRVGRLSM